MVIPRCLIVPAFLSVGIIAEAQIKVNDRIETSWLNCDLGLVDIGTTADCVLCLKNISEVILEIDYLMTSCKCVTAHAPKKAMAPEETMRVLISFKTSGKSPGRISQRIILGLSDGATYAFDINAILYRGDVPVKLQDM